ncbi:LemA family protein [bacterium]|nr:LemA family protein [bacterium]
MRIEAWQKKYAIMLLTLLMLFYMIGKLVYNKLVDEAHLLHISHGKLETEMQKRHDIVTRTIAAVNQYMETEEEVFNKLVTLNGMIEAGVGEPMLISARMEIIVLMNSLTFLKEAYPELRANEPYLYLMETLQATGRLVTEARMKYNESAFEYNMVRELFPYRIFSTLYGFDKAHFFEAEKGARKALSLDGMFVVKK